MEDIKLSVLVTFCNQKEFIRETLDSIVSQKVDFAYEVLVCLDRECPQSEQIIGEYIKKYPFIKLFKVDNSNLDTINIIKASKNRLKLLLEAKGEYFCFLDGDDFYINNNRFQKLVAFLDKKTAFIGAFHDYCTYDHKEKVLKTAVKYGNEEMALSAEIYLKNKIHIQYSNYIYRNIFKGKIPPDFNEDALNDTSFICYMLKYGDTYHIPGLMLAYRINVNSIYNNLSFDIQNLYALLYSEINQKILPQYEHLIRDMNKVVLKSAVRFCTKNDLSDINEIRLIKDVANKHQCYFTESLLNYNNLTFFEKLNLKKNVYLYLNKCNKPMTYIKNL